MRPSQIDDDFWMRDPFIAPSLHWDRQNLDVDLRIGIVRTSDITIEQSFNKAELRDGSTLESDEWLISRRIFW